VATRWIVIGTGDLMPATADGDFEPDLAGGTTSPAGETQPGISIGTPAYMSPEQARDALDQLGPASDVYSLGATLYELLTGQVAFPGEKAGAVIDQVLAGDFLPPRAVLRSVPAPLEAICLKAMALAPELRYDSVRALARDLEHWLADEPVAAYPERRHQRLGRWLRQHRSSGPSTGRGKRTGSMPSAQLWTQVDDRRSWRTWRCERLAEPW
jgi:serine/threonine protein kinase